MQVLVINVRPELTIHLLILVFNAKRKLFSMVALIHVFLSVLQSHILILLAKLVNLV